MRFVNMDLLIDYINKLDGDKIDKTILLRVINNCEVEPYKELLLKLYKERNK